MEQETQQREIANVWSQIRRAAAEGRRPLTRRVRTLVKVLQHERINTAAAMKANSDIWIHLHAGTRISNRIPGPKARVGHKSQMSKSGWMGDRVIPLGLRNARGGGGDKRRRRLPTPWTENHRVRTGRERGDYRRA